MILFYPLGQISQSFEDKSNIPRGPIFGCPRENIHLYMPTNVSHESFMVAKPHYEVKGI